MNACRVGERCSATDIPFVHTTRSIHTRSPLPVCDLLISFRLLGWLAGGSLRSACGVCLTAASESIKVKSEVVESQNDQHSLC